MKALGADSDPAKELLNLFRGAPITDIKSLMGGESDPTKVLLFSLHYGGARVEDIKSLLDRGALVNAQDRVGRTPLILAAGRGCNDIVRLLCANGADVTRVDEDGNTPLHFAVGNLRNMATLLKHGADVTARNMKGRDAISNAERHSNNAAELLVVFGAKRREEPMSRFGHDLGYAVSQDDLPLLKALVKAGASIRLHGGGLLMRAIEKGHKEIAQFLIKEGADVNYQVRYGSPIESAIASGQQEFIEILVKGGVDLRKKNIFGKDALEIARNYRNADMITLIAAAIERQR